MLVTLAKRQLDCHFAGCPAVLAQVLAAHRDTDVACNLFGRETRCRGPVTVHGDLDLAVAQLGVRAKVLESFHVGEEAQYVNTEFVEDFCRIAR